MHSEIPSFLPDDTFFISRCIVDIRKASHYRPSQTLSVRMGYELFKSSNRVFLTYFANHFSPNMHSEIPSFLPDDTFFISRWIVDIRKASHYRPSQSLSLR